jgi:hypothetical protein
VPGVFCGSGGGGLDLDGEDVAGGDRCDPVDLVPVFLVA